MQNPGDADYPHCDDFIHRHSVPLCLRYWLLVERMPAVDKGIVTQMHGAPKCFADYEGKRVRLVMASRFGDVGITYNLKSEYGYERRVSVPELYNFSAEP